MSNAAVALHPHRAMTNAATVTLHPHIAIVETPHGLGLRATGGTVRRGEVALRCPRAAQLDAATPVLLADRLLEEFAKGAASPHAAWLASLPRGVAFSASGCDDATAAALCAVAGGGLGNCAYVEAVARSRGGARTLDEAWARSYVRANALRTAGGRLRLAPVFTLLNHAASASEPMQPTEHDDGSFSLVAASDVARGDDVCIDYGVAGAAGLLDRYGFAEAEPVVEYVVFAPLPGDGRLAALRARLHLDAGVKLRSAGAGPNSNRFSGRASSASRARVATRRRT